MKDLSLITLARILVVVCQLINIKLFTHYLTVQQLGFYFFLLTVSYFANALIFVPVDYYQQSKLHKMIELTGGVRPLFDFNLKLLSVYMGVTLLLIIGSLMIAPHYVLHVLLAAMLAVALYVVQALRNTLNNLDHKTVVSLSLVQEAVIKILVFLALVKMLPASELSLMAAWLITLLLNIIPLYFTIKKYVTLAYHEKYVVAINEVFHFSYPISLSAVSNWVQLQGYRLILVPLGFADMVGIYAPVSGIGSAGMGAASSIFNQAFSPKIYKTSGNFTTTYLWYALLMTCGILLISSIFGHFIVRLATKPMFAPYWSLMIYGVLNDAANLVIGALAIHITLTGCTRKIMHSSVVGVSSLLVSFAFLFLIKKINVYTIGLPLVLSQLGVIVYMYRDFKQCKIN